jgi:hypothetical protein
LSSGEDDVDAKKKISFQSSKLQWHLTALDDGNCRSQSTIVVVDLPLPMMPEEEGLKLLPVLIGGSINQCRWVDPGHR